MIVQRQSSLLKFRPVKVFRRHTMLFHGNAVINRAKEFAEIAANTFFYFYGIGAGLQAGNGVIAGGGSAHAAAYSSGLICCGDRGIGDPCGNG